MLGTSMITHIVRDWILFFLEREIILGDSNEKSNDYKSQPVLTFHKKSRTTDVPDPQGATKVKKPNVRGTRPVIFGIFSHEFIHILDTVP